MKLENQLQPNCSELGLALNAGSVAEAVNDLRNAGLKVCLCYKEKEWDALPAQTIELFVEQFHACSGSRIDKLKLFLAMAKLPENLAKALGHNSETDMGTPEVCVSYRGKSVHFQLGDYCSGGDRPTLEIGDHDQEFFNVFYALDGRGEVYGIDGGNTDAYDKYVTRRKSKEDK